MGFLKSPEGFGTFPGGFCAAPLGAGGSPAHFGWGPWGFGKSPWRFPAGNGGAGKSLRGGGGFSGGFHTAPRGAGGFHRDVWKIPRGSGESHGGLGKVRDDAAGFGRQAPARHIRLWKPRAARDCLGRLREVKIKGFALRALRCRHYPIIGRDATPSGPIFVIKQARQGTTAWPATTPPTPP
jgi:hypothetical protein